MKMLKGKSHAADLKDIMGSLRNYNMHLNLTKCSFGVQAGKLLGFMLTKRGIEANLDKCQAIIDMRSSSNVKEVQKLIGPSHVSFPMQVTSLSTSSSR